MYDNESDYNYASEDNGAKILNCSSEAKKCFCKNILSSDRKVILNNSLINL